MLKGYNGRQLKTEFSDEGWTKSSINRLLKKFSDVRCNGDCGSVNFVSSDALHCRHRN